MGGLKNPKYPLMLGVIDVKRNAKWCAQFWRKVKPSKVLIQISLTESNRRCHAQVPGSYICAPVKNVEDNMLVKVKPNSKNAIQTTSRK